LFEVGGARGGRGGLGQPNTCTDDPINRSQYSGYSCLSGVGGANSPGGAGGDAGSVFLGFLTPHEKDMTAQVSVKGGPGGSMSRFVMPRDYTSSNICNFRDGLQQEIEVQEYRTPRMLLNAILKTPRIVTLPSEVRRLPELPPEIRAVLRDTGKDGRFVVQRVSLAQAWSQVYQIAQAFDLIQHDVKELAKNAVNDTRISSLSFAEFLRSSARQLQVTAESKLAVQVVPYALRP
jgi:hypothetical protein